MKQDKLNNDIFTRNGKNIRRAQKLNLFQISDYFKQQGYQILKINQWWRHAHAKLKKADKIYFMKMASTKDITERTQNEVAWNKQVLQKIKKQKITNFLVPKIFKTGNMKGKFYYVSEYFSSGLLSERGKRVKPDLEKWFKKIVESNNFIMNLKNIKLPRDQYRKSLHKRWHEYYVHMTNLYQAVKEHGLLDIFLEIEDIKKNWQPGPAHGDFVPWHMIKHDHKFVLIDGEASSVKNVKYYDVAHFYHRLYTSAESPRLAKKYINLFRNSIASHKDKNQFDKLIKSIIAARLIGGYWDAKNDGVKNFNYHHELKKDFLSNNLY